MNFGREKKHPLENEEDFRCMIAIGEFIFLIIYARKRPLGVSSFPAIFGKIRDDDVVDKFPEDGQYIFHNSTGLDELLTSRSVPRGESPSRCPLKFSRFFFVFCFGFGGQSMWGREPQIWRILKVAAVAKEIFPKITKNFSF